MADMDELAQSITHTMQQMSDTGLCHLRGGNCSVRTGVDEFVVTRTKAPKDRLRAEHLVTSPITQDVDVPGASINLRLHRLVYRRSSASVVLHGHPYHAALYSYFHSNLSPIDENSLSYLSSTIRIIGASGFKEWRSIEPDLADALLESPAVILRWHGAYTIGADLGEAFHRMQALDYAARFVLDVRRMERETSTHATIPGYAEASLTSDSSHQS